MGGLFFLSIVLVLDEQLNWNMCEPNELVCSKSICTYKLNVYKQIEWVWPLSWERNRETQLRKEKDRAAGVPDWDYEQMRALVKNEKLPAMFVEQNFMNRNIQRLVHVAWSHGKTIRLATKSIRVPAIIVSFPYASFISLRFFHI